MTASRSNKKSVSQEPYPSLSCLSQFSMEDCRYVTFMSISTSVLHEVENYDQQFYLSFLSVA